MQDGILQLLEQLRVPCVAQDITARHRLRVPCVRQAQQASKDYV